MKYTRLLIFMLACPLLFVPFLIEGANFKAPSTQEVASQEARLIAAVNQVRRQKGLAALSAWNTLSFYARQHSRNMANGSVKFGHGGFEARAESIQKSSPCHSVGENVAYCYLIDDPLKKSVEMWMDSPHHRDNILGDYRETGMGIAYDSEGRCFITQMFSKRRG